jgi:OmpA-OmpF porin, OOP family
MANKSLLRLPHVGLALVTALAWGAGSTYWYVCRTEQLCDKKADAVVKVDSAKQEAKNTSPTTTIVTPDTVPSAAKVFFLPDSTEQVADVDLSGIADYAKNHQNSKVEVTGYFANVDGGVDVGDLSVLRSDVVKSKLVELGVPADRIVVMAKGADLAATGSDEATVANGRRVEVAIK